MLNKIMKMLYFLTIIIATYIIISSAKVTIHETFIENQLDNLQESENFHEDLIQTVSLIYSNKKRESYVYKDPIFQEIYTLSDNSNVIYEFQLSFYKYVEVYKKETKNSLAIIMDNIQINDPEVFLTERKQFVLDLKIEFDTPVSYKGNEFTFSTERFQIYEGLNAGLLLINYDFLQNKDGKYSNFKTMDFTYLTKGDVEKPLLTLFNEDLISTSDVEIKDTLKDPVERSIKNVHSSNIVLETIDMNLIKNDTDYYYNDKIKKSLNSNNIIYVKYIGIEVLVIAVVTYFLFLHKYVMEIYKTRKMKKALEIEEMKDKLKERKEE